MNDSTKHWADREERGSFWLMKFTAVAVKVLGRRLLSPLLYSIVFYFFLFGRTPTMEVETAPAVAIQQGSASSRAGKASRRLSEQ